MTPKPLASSSVASRQPTVTSASGLDVLLQHLFVVHLVDMVAGEDDHELRRVALDDVDVLIDRVGRAEIPHRLGDALRGRQDVETLVAFGPEKVPAALQMADQAVRLVLGGDRDAADAGIQRVRQREIDDARFAAEIDRGLGAPVGQLHQSAAAAACQHIRHRVTGVGRSRAPDPWSLFGGSCAPPQSELVRRCDRAPSGSAWARILDKSAASGGRVSAAEAGKPCSGRRSAMTPPRLPTFEPP